MSSVASAVVWLAGCIWGTFAVLGRWEVGVVVVLHRLVIFHTSLRKQ